MGLTPGACWSPASVGLQGPHTSPLAWSGTTAGMAVALAAPAVAATWSAKRRNLWPSANTTPKPFRCRTRYHRVWNCVRSVLQRRDDGMATSFFGSLRSAWRRQVPSALPEAAFAYSWWYCRSHRSGRRGRDRSALGRLPRVETPDRAAE